MSLQVDKLVCKELVLLGSWFFSYKHSTSKHHISRPSLWGRGWGRGQLVVHLVAAFCLKLHRNTSHHIKPCHWDETNLRITVLVRMTVVIEDGTIHPSAGSIMAIEDIVEVHTEDSFLQTCNVFAWTKGIAEVDIRL